MSQTNSKPTRSWREIAQLAASEHDPQRVLQLAQELVRALDAESDKRMQKVAETNKAAHEKGAA
jgi:hypothetical protein